MHKAAFCGHLEIVDELIQAGSPLDEKNNRLKTPEDLAERRKHEDVVTLIKVSEYHGACVLMMCRMRVDGVRCMKR